MVKLQEKLAFVFDSCNSLLAVAAGIILTAMMLILTAEVVMRYFLRRPMAWVMESTELILVLTCFLGTTWLLKKERHVILDVVLNRLNQRARGLANTITSCVGAITCLIIAWYAFVVTWDFFLRDVTTAGLIAIPKGPFIAVMLLGFFLLFIQFTRRAYAYWRSRESGQ